MQARICNLVIRLQYVQNCKLWPTKNNIPLVYQFHHVCLSTCKNSRLNVCLWNLQSSLSESSQHIPVLNLNKNNGFYISGKTYMEQNVSWEANTYPDNQEISCINTKSKGSSYLQWPDNGPYIYESSPHPPIFKINSNIITPIYT